MTKEEFSALLLRYERLVYTVCLQLVRHPDTAQDLTQETFLAAYTHRDTMPAGYERQWLTRIAANKAKDYLQSAWSRHAALPGDEAMPPGLSPPAEKVALARCAEEELQALVRALRPPYGAVCTLCLLEEKTPEEAALLLGRPTKTIYTQLARGKALLRAELERRGYHDGHFSR